MKQLGLALLCVPLLGACIVAAGAGLGYVLSERALQDGSLEARVHDDVERVWDVARESMEILIDPTTSISLESSPRLVRGIIELDHFEIEVQAFDYLDTIILVRSDPVVSGARRRKVMNYVLERLSKSRAAKEPQSGVRVGLRASARKGL